MPARQSWRARKCVPCLPFSLQSNQESVLSAFSEVHHDPGKRSRLGHPKKCGAHTQPDTARIPECHDFPCLPGKWRVRFSVPYLLHPKNAVPTRSRTPPGYQNAMISHACQENGVSDFPCPICFTRKMRCPHAAGHRADTRMP